jgi:radical SAM protein with 4Fe4S-binding SPASM domain
MRAKIGYMRPSLFKKIIDQISLYPETAVILHFRGESLLHPDFCNLLSYTRKKIKGRILIATNGTLLSEKIIHCLTNNKVDFVSISFDAIAPNIYLKIRRGSNYEETFCNIMRLIKLKRHKKAKFPIIQISMVETKLNQKDKYDFVKFWLKKVDRVRIYRQHSKKGRFGNVNINIKRSSGLRNPCPNLLTDMAIYWNGEAALCSHDWRRKFSLGNLKQHSIIDIWHSKKYKSIRLSHWRRTFKELSCKYCDQWLAKYMPHKVIGELYSYRKQKIREGE